MGLRLTDWACKSLSTAMTTEEERRGSKAIARPWSLTTSFSLLSRLSFGSHGDDWASAASPPSLREVLAGDECCRPFPCIFRRLVSTRYASVTLPFPSCCAELKTPNPNASYLYSDLPQLRVYTWRLLTSSFRKLIGCTRVLCCVRPLLLQRVYDSGAANFLKK